MRYPGVVSADAQPGGGTTDYAVDVYYAALRKQHFSCFLKEDTVLPMMYMDDTLRGTYDFMFADEDKLSTRVYVCKDRTAHAVRRCGFAFGLLFYSTLCCCPCLRLVVVVVVCAHSYNLAAMSFTPAQQVESIRKVMPLEASYEPDNRQAIAATWPAVLDDSLARQDWGWQPEYDLDAMTKSMLERLASKGIGSEQDLADHVHA